MDDDRGLIVYGAGGLGREVMQIARLQFPRVMGYVDDGVEAGTVRDGAVTLGGGDFLDGIGEPCALVFGIAEMEIKKGLYLKLKNNPRLSFPNIIHPSAVVSEYATLGEGIVIAANCVVNVDAALGNCVLSDYGTVIGHDAVVGDYVSIMPAAAIAGCVAIGERCLIGAGSLIRQGLRVGEGSVVGMGAVVVRDVPAGVVVAGNPAKRILKK
jgi:sugar O-acyltransferase (sialic acid O-acetyltransferase NeuD family)